MQEGSTGQLLGQEEDEAESSLQVPACAATSLCHSFRSQFAPLLLQSHTKVSLQAQAECSVGPAAQTS